MLPSVYHQFHIVSKCKGATEVEANFHCFLL